MVLDGAVARHGNRHGWPEVAMGQIVSQRKEFGQPALQLLGVSVAHGVRPRFEDDGRPAASLDLSGYKVVHPGDIIMNALGKPHGSIGRADTGGITSPAYWVLEPVASADSRFLHYMLRSRHLVEEYQRLGKYLPPNQFDISWDAFRSISLPLPPLAVQRRIADFLDDQVGRIDAVVDLRERQTIAARNLLESVAHQAVTGGGTDPDRVTSESALPWSAAVPPNWGTPRICQVARMGTGHTPSRERSELWEDAKIPWLTTSDVHRFRADEIDVIDDTELHISRLGIENSAAVLHPVGTVALSRTASAGFSIVMGADMATSQDYATWTCGPRLQPHFLLWCLRAMRRDLLGRLAMGSTHKTIYFPDLMSIRIPLPSVAEQLSAVTRIHEAAEVSRAMQAALQAAVSLLNERKRALITAAVTGEFDVTAASTRASEVAMTGTGGVS